MNKLNIHDKTKTCKTWREIDQELRDAIIYDYREAGIRYNQAYLELRKVQFLLEPEACEIKGKPQVVIGEIPHRDPNQYLLLVRTPNAKLGDQYGFITLS